MAARQTPQEGAFFGSNGVGSEYTSWAITITNAHGDLQGTACRRGDGSVKNRSLRMGLYSLESGRNETRWLHRNYVCILLPDALCWHKLRPLHRKKCFITRGATVPSPIPQRMRVPRTYHCLSHYGRCSDPDTSWYRIPSICGPAPLPGLILTLIPQELAALAFCDHRSSSS